MIVRGGRLKRVGAAAKKSLARPHHPSGLGSVCACADSTSNHDIKRRHVLIGSPVGRIFKQSFGTSPRSQQERKREQEKGREILMSVLESSATKRDARAYIQTYSPIVARGVAVGSETAPFVQGSRDEQAPGRQNQGAAGADEIDERPRVAVVKLRRPQDWSDDLLGGVIKTLVQLRDLGLQSVIVLDCDLGLEDGTTYRSITSQQTHRIQECVGQHGQPAAKLAAANIRRMERTATGWAPASSLLSSRRPPPSPAIRDPDLVVVLGEEALTDALVAGHMLICPCWAYSSGHDKVIIGPADPNQVVYTLVRYFAGLQLHRLAWQKEEDSGTRDGKRGCVVEETEGKASEDEIQRPYPTVWVNKIIVIDPIGGLPSSRQGHAPRVFINLEHEFESVHNALSSGALECRPGSRNDDQAEADMEADTRQGHLENLKLVKDALSILPPTSSAIITSPEEAAFVKPPPRFEESGKGVSLSPVDSSSLHRERRNPLIHNLLTNRPIYSASLPPERMLPQAGWEAATMRPSATAPQRTTSPLRMPTTTLAKKGIPVTIFPDPRETRWAPPTPDSHRLRLTDACIDLGRLVYLINDSFGRSLDVEHYLRRVNDSLAGIIIAGEYEGGAILTWEQPPPRPGTGDAEAAHRKGRLVPYLDKFAVLKRSQGAGGVADMVFNAMVMDCFPGGVCWRSRKDNPVNKWYSERSQGRQKLAGSNWTMFWTGGTGDGAEPVDMRRVMDYEAVCRAVEPSWADGMARAD